MTLKKRLERLEARSGPPPEVIQVIRHIVGPNGNGVITTMIRMPDGWRQSEGALEEVKPNMSLRPN